jgi:hypothetical protein
MKKAPLLGGTGMPDRERSRICEVPSVLPHHGLADAITPHQAFNTAFAAKLLRSRGSAAGTAKACWTFDRSEHN